MKKNSPPPAQRFGNFLPGFLSVTKQSKSDHEVILKKQQEFQQWKEECNQFAELCRIIMVMNPMPMDPLGNWVGYLFKALYWQKEIALKNNLVHWMLDECQMSMQLLQMNSINFVWPDQSHCSKFFASIPEYPELFLEILSYWNKQDNLLKMPNVGNISEMCYFLMKASEYQYGTTANDVQKLIGPLIDLFEKRYTSLQDYNDFYKIFLTVQRRLWNLARAIISRAIISADYNLDGHDSIRGLLFYIVLQSQSVIDEHYGLQYEVHNIINLLTNHRASILDDCLQGVIKEFTHQAIYKLLYTLLTNKNFENINKSEDIVTQILEFYLIKENYEPQEFVEKNILQLLYNSSSLWQAFLYKKIEFFSRNKSITNPHLRIILMQLSIDYHGITIFEAEERDARNYIKQEYHDGLHDIQHKATINYTRLYNELLQKKEKLYDLNKKTLRNLQQEREENKKLLINLDENTKLCDQRQSHISELQEKIDVLTQEIYEHNKIKQKLAKKLKAWEARESDYQIHKQAEQVLQKSQMDLEKKNIELERAICEIRRNQQEAQKELKQLQVQYQALKEQNARQKINIKDLMEQLKNLQQEYDNCKAELKNSKLVCEDLLNSLQVAILAGSNIHTGHPNFHTDGRSFWLNPDESYQLQLDTLALEENSNYVIPPLKMDPEEIIIWQDLRSKAPLPIFSQEICKFIEKKLPRVTIIPLNGLQQLADRHKQLPQTVTTKTCIDMLSVSKSLITPLQRDIESLFVIAKPHFFVQQDPQNHKTNVDKLAKIMNEFFRSWSMIDIDASYSYFVVINLSIKSYTMLELLLQILHETAQGNSTEPTNLHKIKFFVSQAQTNLNIKLKQESLSLLNSLYNFGHMVYWKGGNWCEKMDELFMSCCNVNDPTSGFSKEDSYLQIRQQVSEFENLFIECLKHMRLFLYCFTKNQQPDLTIEGLSIDEITSMLNPIPVKRSTQSGRLVRC